jgi:hypothetical protein
MFKCFSNDFAKIDYSIFIQSLEQPEYSRPPRETAKILLLRNLQNQLRARMPHKRRKDVKRVKCRARCKRSALTGTAQRQAANRLRA